MIEKDVENFDEMNEFLKVEKDLFFTNLILCIESGWENNVEVVDVAVFKIAETGNAIHISIEREDWYETLHLGLYHFEETENYEYCSEINNLIGKMYYFDD